MNFMVLPPEWPARIYASAQGRPRYGSSGGLGWAGRRAGDSGLVPLLISGLTLGQVRRGRVRRPRWRPRPPYLIG